MKLFNYMIVRSTGQRILGYKHKVYTNSPVRNKPQLTLSVETNNHRNFYYDTIAAMCSGCASSSEYRLCS